MKATVASHWRSAVLVCRKCSKKLDGGFGPKGRQSLARALKKHLGGGKGRKARAGIVEVSCLKICPHGAVTVVDGRHPESWLLVRAGTPVEEVAGVLGLE